MQLRTEVQIIALIVQLLFIQIIHCTIFSIWSPTMHDVLVHTSFALKPGELPGWMGGCFVVQMLL